MADISEHQLDMVRDIAPQMTVRLTVKRLREYRVRLWIASKLLWLVARIANCQVMIVEHEGSDGGAG